MTLSVQALAPVALVLAFGLGTLAPHAQTTPAKVGFVSVDALFTAHPSHKDVTAIQGQYQPALADLEKKIKDIDAKGASATAAEKDQKNQLLTTYNAKVKSYEEQLKAKTGPMETAIDKALDAYAKANGFSIIMDRAVAQQAGLVVYADPSTDLTEAVKKTIK